MALDKKLAANTPLKAACNRAAKVLASACHRRFLPRGRDHGNAVRALSGRNSAAAPATVSGEPFAHQTTGAKALGRSAKARTREPGDRPTTSSTNRRRWDGRGTHDPGQTAVRLCARRSPHCGAAANPCPRPSHVGAAWRDHRHRRPRRRAGNATGSDVTVIPGSRIQEWGANGITEVLREAVGVDVTPSGGPNTATEVRIRGGDPGQSLVMIDGIPIGNVAGTLAVDRGYFQTANLADAEAPPHRPSSARPGSVTPQPLPRGARSLRATERAGAFPASGR